MRVKLKNNSYKKGYLLSDSASKRRSALDAEIAKKSRIDGIKKNAAAQKKKARLNVLRIYRRNAKRGTTAHKHCQKITADMRYIDKKYLKNGVTRDICGRVKKSVR